MLQSLRFNFTLKLSVAILEFLSKKFLRAFSIIRTCETEKMKTIIIFRQLCTFTHICLVFQTVLLKNIIFSSDWLQIQIGWLLRTFFVPLLYLYSLFRAYANIRVPGNFYVFLSHLEIPVIDISRNGCTGNGWKF